MDTRQQDEDQDVEIFERIPWESLEQKPDRRRLVYLGAVAVVLAAVGVTIGRGMAPGQVAPAPTVPETALLPVTTAPLDLPADPTPAADPAVAQDPTGDMPGPGIWSEADLMAAPLGGLETVAAGWAEWFVIDWFTRDGSGSATGRSFVEWASATAFEWIDGDTIDVTVTVRRLAAEGDGPYVRLPEEAWTVTTRVERDRWLIVEGPVRAEAAVATLAIPDRPDDSEGSIEEDQLVAVDWVDEAGLTWRVLERSTG